MTSDVEALRKVRFFEELTDDDLSRVAKVGQRRSYAAGDALVERDSDRGGLFVILSGARRSRSAVPSTTSRPATSSARWHCSATRADPRA